MKLRFRNISEDDLKMILGWRTKPEVTKYMYTDIAPDMEKQREWFRKITDDRTRLDWIINVDGEDVGLLSVVKIDRLHRRCELGWYLASPSVRGKGIGTSVQMNLLTYVFQKLQMNKLCCEALSSNEQAIRVYEKCGLGVEGTRRRHIFKNGEFHDIVEMGILRDEWESRIRGTVEFVRAEIDSTDKEVTGVRLDIQ